MAESLDTLVADADRTTAADEMRQHYDSGRLTLDEFESRLAEVHTARTRGDLEQAFRQLPRTEPPASLRLRDRRWSSLALQYALINLICIAVWALAGNQGGFWPKWVLLGTLMMYFRSPRPALRQARAATAKRRAVEGGFPLVCAVGVTLLAARRRAPQVGKRSERGLRFALRRIPRSGDAGLERRADGQCQRGPRRRTEWTHPSGSPPVEGSKDPRMGHAFVACRDEVELEALPSAEAEGRTADRSTSVPHLN